MIELDTLWGCQRFIKINGKPQRIPFGIDINPDFVAPIRRWISCSGHIFAAKRVKALKTWALQILSGNCEYKDTWIAYTNYRGFIIPKLALFKYLIDNRHDLKIIRTIMIVLNSYKMVIIGSPSLSSITDVPKSDETGPYVSKLRLYIDLPQIPNFVWESTKAINTKSKYCDDFGRTHEGPYGEPDNDWIRFLGASIEPKCLGRIVPIVDKGKWRNILVGHQSLQCQTKKLADWLREWLWSQPEIASGDQRKMIDFCIKSLKEDRYMLSIDLSEATDRLSRHFQVKLLESMGAPKGSFQFLELPCYYRDKDFGGSSDELKKCYYSNGQPMGLFLSFPMFELAHFVILKYVVAPYKAQFSICGDDVVIACEKKDAVRLYERYSCLITRFGGKISLSKTLKSSQMAEGVGAMFLKGIHKEIRIPSGKLSPLEAFTPGTWLYSEINSQSPVGRAILSNWLQTKLEKEYTYQQRRQANESVVLTDLSTLSNEALRSLFRPDHEPTIYSRFDADSYSFWRNTPEERESTSYHWVGLSWFQDALVSNKIISLYKKEFENGQHK